MSLLLDGVTDHIGYGNPHGWDSAGVPKSISLFVKPLGSFPANNQALVTRNNAADTVDRFDLYIKATTGQLLCWTGTTTSYREVAGPNLSIGTEYHVVFTHDGTPAGLKLYVDGVEYSSVGGSGTTYEPNDGSMSLGGFTFADTQNFEGEMRDVGFWDYLIPNRMARSLATMSPLWFPRGLKWAPPLNGDTRDPATGLAGARDGGSFVARSHATLPPTRRRWIRTLEPVAEEESTHRHSKREVAARRSSTRPKYRWPVRSSVGVK